jgi:membrane protein
VGTAATTAGAAEATSTAATAYAQVTTWAGSYAPYVMAVVVIAAAMSVFGQFVGALEVIWKTPRTRTPVRGFLRSNALSLVLLAVAAVALLAAILLSSVVVMFGSIALSYIEALGVELSGIGLALLARGVVVFVAAALLFEVAFTVVPDRALKWRDVLPGALITAGLFLVGETALSTYLNTTERFSVFGTFQFFVVLIVWIYYSSLVALWGAELTRLLVLRFEAGREEAAEAGAST